MVIKSPVRKEEIIIRRISVGGDWTCCICKSGRWCHYGIKIPYGKGYKIFYVCKDCMENAPHTNSIQEFKQSKIGKNK